MQRCGNAGVLEFNTITSEAYSFWGQSMNELEARIEQLEKLMWQVVRERGIEITCDGRVDESTAAELIGYKPNSLKAMRNTFNSGPAWYRAPVNSARVSYRLHDLAQWIEVKREDGL